MICSVCQQDNDAGTFLCSRCGVRLDRRMPPQLVLESFFTREIVWGITVGNLILPLMVLAGGFWGGLCNLGFFRLFQLLEYRGVRSTWSWHDLHIVSAADLPESPVVFARTRNINDVWLDGCRHSRTGSGALSLQPVVRIIDSSAVHQSISASHMTL